MQALIRKGRPSDIEEISALYDALCDSMVGVENSPGWKKGIYPTAEVATQGIQENHLYVAEIEDKILGSIMLTHEPEPNYDTVNWLVEADDSHVFIIRTLGVHPEARGKGIAKLLLQFAEIEGKAQGMKALRLDVYEKNSPAIQLYKRCGFDYRATIDIGLSCYGMDNFHIFEKII